MFFENCDPGIRLYTVTNLKWGSSSHKVLPRIHNALVYRVKGKADFHFGDGRTISTGAGEIFYCPANLGYDVEYDDGEIIAVHFDMNGISPIPEVIVPAFGRKVSDIFFNMLDIWTEHKSGYYYITLAELFEIFSLCCIDKNNRTYAKKEYICAAEYLISNALSEIGDISSVCAEFNVSESGFRNYFHGVYGVSPVKYITEIRIREAEKLLVSTNDTIESIAYKCRFNDVKYFSRVFCKYRGCPPSEFRKY